MRFKSLEIHNFKAITYLNLTDLDDVVFIAGPNGCGKSCVFDAIRLLKSGYGGYNPNEWQNWFSEFQINFTGNKGGLRNLFQDQNKEIRIRAEILLAPEELKWIRDNAESLVRENAWRTFVPEVAGWRVLEALPLATQYRAHETEVLDKVSTSLPELLLELKAKTLTAEIVISPTAENIDFEKSQALELIFSRYIPEFIGVIDYHGPQRNYSREEIGGINLNIETEHQLGQHALYNYSNKYANIKTQLAASYVRELISEKAGTSNSGVSGFNETLKELFSIFFPGKEFLGTQPTTDGKLLFNVKTQSGAVHDINELSSGEKEILYGYLRLRNAALKNSVLLIDEPELHLNPRLTLGLPDFYHRHIGKALGNQIWLVTHSDSLLRQAVGNPAFKVFHMHAPGSMPESENQVSEIKVSEETEQAVIDLVGDLAAYRPGVPGIFIEGGGDSEFDKSMISRLFPDFSTKVNLIATGNKQRVRALHAVLEKAKTGGAIPFDFYSIIDHDTDEEVILVEDSKRRFKWDRYHIENYLLETHYILMAINTLQVPKSSSWTEGFIESSLKKCAEKTLPSLVGFQLEDYANQKLVRCIRTRTERKSDIVDALDLAVNSSMNRIEQIVKDELKKSDIKKVHTQFTAKLKKDLQSRKWLNTFQGREVLRQFTKDTLKGYVKYEVLRDLIISSMVDQGYRPKGIEKVLNTILKENAA